MLCAFYSLHYHSRFLCLCCRRMFVHNAIWNDLWTFFFHFWKQNCTRNPVSAHKRYYITATQSPRVGHDSQTFELENKKPRFQNGCFSVLFLSRLSLFGWFVFCLFVCLFSGYTSGDTDYPCQNNNFRSEQCRIPFIDDTPHRPTVVHVYTVLKWRT